MRTTLQPRRMKHEAVLPPRAGRDFGGNGSQQLDQFERRWPIGRNRAFTGDTTGAAQDGIDTVGKNQPVVVFTPIKRLPRITPISNDDYGSIEHAPCAAL